MVELVADRGIEAVTVRDLSRMSRISTRAFYTFANVEECFASTYRSIMWRVTEQLSETMAATSDWREGLRAGIRVLLDAVAENPKAAHLALVDCYDGSPAMLREIGKATAELERQLAAFPVPLPLRLIQGIVAGVERVLRTYLLAGRPAELPPLADEVAEWILAVCDSEPAAPPGPAPVSVWRNSRSASQRKDPAYAVFEAVGGDRGRLLAAVARLSVAGGYWRLTLPDVRREAGVSRRRFDALFDSLDSCYVEAVTVLATAAARAASHESAAVADWRIRSGQIAVRFWDAVSRSALIAQLVFLDVFVPGRTGLQCRERLVTMAAGWLHASAPRPHRPTESMAEASVAASWRLIQAELATGDARPRAAAPALIAQLVPTPSATPANQGE